ncbi:MAG: hypothetical protein ACK5DE_02780 [Bacteroidota bacterium]|jgi:hypothetical protein
MKNQKAYSLTEDQINILKLERGIFNKLFKYLEFKGLLYSVPYSATMEEWAAWRDNVKKSYPIQYAIRDTIETLEHRLYYRYTGLRYWIKTFFRAENETIRKAVPTRYTDTTSLIIDVNFAIIKQFKKEADESYVDWDGHESHAEFKKWLDLAYTWITEGRPNLEKERDRAYPKRRSLAEIFKSDSKEDYHSLYGEVHRLEALIAQTDENILIQMIKYREYFWT